ncbi:DinB family protein [Chitinophaga vietnamensis]|uniref:DinB family protein n=1 Tax=Chitinophaga vietnamensis TaxID=2593957 RepID=UPI00117790A3|nr:DinB family protein [Chitinophaga vietnamensis]
MKELLLQYVTYNHWANQQLAPVLLKLGNEQLDRELGGGFGTVRQTVYHIWYGESLWYQRLQLAEKPVDPTAGFDDNFEAACAAWIQQSVKLEAWVQQATPARLDHTIAYTQQKNEHYKLPVQAALMQVCNNGAFYRGQLVYMLKQLGVTKVPSVDFTRFKTRK